MSRRRFKMSLMFRVVIYLGYFSLLNVSVFGDAENDDDDELITQLLEVPIADTIEDSDVSKILKILEAGEQLTTTTTTPRSSWSSSTTTTTTEKPSPFFQTERPSSYYASRSLQRTDNQLNDIISSLMEMEGNGLAQNGTTAMRRSDSHFPPIEGLLWNTARAVWDVSRPAFYNTKAGRKVSLLRDTVTLPLRTFGHIKHKILDLTRYPHGRKRSVHHQHHDDHGWGWGDSHPVYVEYEPRNSLFKAWIRYLYRAIRPAIISKIRLKRLIIRLKIRFLRRMMRLLRSVKLHKLITALAALKARLRPSVVVVKDHHHHDAHDHHHGWGWTEGWKSGPPPTAGYAWAASSPPKATYGPPASQGYDWAASSPPEVSYGPPAHTSYGQKPSWQGYPQRPSPVAYNKDNTYNNYHSPPSGELMAPELYAQASENAPQTNEAPSYAKYLKELGINPSSLSDLDSATRNFREAKGKQEDDVPYLTKEEEANEGAKAPPK